MTSTPATAPYVGDLMLKCLVQPFDFQHTYAVVVSGASLNPCGHLLLNTGGASGWYFHIAEVSGRPRFMREANYRRYIVENKKHELSRAYVPIPKPAGAHEKLEELLAKQWHWFMIANNCATFVEDIVRAGGSQAGLYFNCPSRERFR